MPRDGDGFSLRAYPPSVEVPVFAAFCMTVFWLTVTEYVQALIRTNRCSAISLLTTVKITTAQCPCRVNNLPPSSVFRRTSAHTRLLYTLRVARNAPGGVGPVCRLLRSLLVIGGETVPARRPASVMEGLARDERRAQRERRAHVDGEPPKGTNGRTARARWPN